MNDLKITILSEDFPPAVGGIAQWAMGIADGLKAQGVSINVHCKYFDNYPPAEQSPHTYDVQYHKRSDWKRKRTFYWNEILKTQINNGLIPDFCIATTWNASRGVVGLCQRNGIKLITIAHGLEVTRNMPWIKKMWLKKTLNACWKVISVSEFTKKSIAELYHINDAKLKVLPNGVDPDIYKPTKVPAYLKERYNLGDEQIITTIARVNERKGHDTVISALDIVRRSYTNFKYLISGPDSRGFIDKLKAQVEALDMHEFIQFIGYVDQSEMIDHYNLCDIYIMQSRFMKEKGDCEGFGITFLEANACNKAVVGGNSGGIPDAIENGVSGYLVEPEDVNGLAEKLLYMLENPEHTKKLGENGRQRVLDVYNWNSISISLLKMLYE